MIKYNTKIWLFHIFSFHKSDTLRILAIEMLIIGAFTAGLTWVEHKFLGGTFGLLRDTSMVHGIIGFVLSLLLVFRTNTAYDRWWEGRKHWGALVNNTRNLAIKLETMVPDEKKEDKAFFRTMIPNFVYAFKDHLREGTDVNRLKDIEGKIDAIKDATHKPNLIIRDIYERTNKLHKEGYISGDQLLVLDKELKSFTDIMGACERIKNTPIPYSYNIFLKKFIMFYLATIPFGFIMVFDWWAIPITMFIFYVLVSLEVIAEEIEDPFGDDDNDLPLDELSDKIRDNVHEIFDHA